jgi:hypothetical protein
MVQCFSFDTHPHLFIPQCLARSNVRCHELDFVWLLKANIRNIQASCSNIARWIGVKSAEFHSSLKIRYICRCWFHDHVSIHADDSFRTKYNWTHFQLIQPYSWIQIRWKINKMTFVFTFARKWKEKVSNPFQIRSWEEKESSKLFRHYQQDSKSGYHSVAGHLLSKWRIVVRLRLLVFHSISLLIFSFSDWVFLKSKIERLLSWWFSEISIQPASFNGRTFVWPAEDDDLNPSVRIYFHCIYPIFDRHTEIVEIQIVSSISWRWQTSQAVILQMNLWNCRGPFLKFIHTLTNFITGKCNISPSHWSFPGQIR